MIKSTAPDAYAIFYPYKEEKTSIGKPFKDSYLNTDEVVVKTDILSVSTTKGKGGAGHWSITLAGSKNYKKLIQPGTWCSIFISDQKFTEKATSATEDSGLKMVGIVKTVRVVENTDSGSGTRTIRYELAGDDFHHLLNTQIYMNSCVVGATTGDTKPLTDSLTFFRAINTTAFSPQGAVRAILRAIVGGTDSVSKLLNKATVTAGGVVAIPPEVSNFLEGNTGTNKLIDALGFFFQKNLMGQMYIQPDLGSQFSAWSMAESYAHRILNELYSELLPVLNDDNSVTLRPSIVLRAIPFSSPRKSGSKKQKSPSDAKNAKTGASSVNADQDPDLLTYPTLSVSDFGKLRNDDDITEDTGVQLYVSKEIREDEIMSLNYGKSDSERFNFFYITGNLVLDSQLSGAKLFELLSGGTIAQLGDQASMARNGLRTYIDTSQYMNLQTFDILKINKTVRDLWSRAYLFENGQVLISGSGTHIPIGTNVSFPDRGWIAHVEQVSHSYSVSGGVKSFRTTISFVRLQTLDGEPIDLKENVEGDENYLQGRNSSHPNDDFGN